HSLIKVCIFCHFADILQEYLPLCSPRLLEKGTDGYWYNGKWNLLRCRLNEYLPTLSTYKCLRHKTFFIVGDSTARQYYAFLIKLVQDINVQLPDAIREWEKIHKSINIQFHFHTFPRNTRTPLQMSDIKYTADLIDSIVGGPDVVIILSLWAHYSAVPSETFLSRVYGIRHAIERLHSRSPDTKVVWRTGNTRKHMTVAHVIENGNWVAYQNLLGARQILQGLDIFFMDVWDMSVCEDVYKLHPGPNVIKNHIDLILNYVCQEP
ncbi:PREDICTED: NXPE family member 3-like, partial [Branchiostoma belcheri]|uniref:NXPE family member 3-like n=1 Tax=Branchiostoma belcheri TaxID=7741 RepID=A0A6P4YLZ9_BRABE